LESRYHEIYPDLYSYNIYNIYILNITMDNFFACTLIVEVDKNEFRLWDNMLVLEMKKLLADGKYSDVTFVVEGEKVKAHRLVLAAHCDYFDR